MASDGDIRVLFVLDVVLSAVFTSAVLYGLDYIGVTPFTTRNLLLGTALVAVLTYVVVLRE
jgi:hypothetical protein